ncbi:MAG: hypothetical protein VR72_16015, partial [Clostridiaceae bacterium BRH_c20a]
NLFINSFLILDTSLFPDLPLSISNLILCSFSASAMISSAFIPLLITSLLLIIISSGTISYGINS